MPPNKCKSANCDKTLSGGAKRWYINKLHLNFHWQDTCGEICTLPFISKVV